MTNPLSLIGCSPDAFVFLLWRFGGRSTRQEGGLRARPVRMMARGRIRCAIRTRPCRSLPAALATLLARHGAVVAADADEPMVEQRVVGNLVLDDVVPRFLLGPAGEWVDLERARTSRSRRRWGRRNGPRTDRGEGRDPGRPAREGTAVRLDLAELAAEVGVTHPEGRAVLGRLLLVGQLRLVHLDVERPRAAVARSRVWCVSWKR